MKELAQHITDLVENSVEAGAKRVEILLDEAPGEDRLTVTVADDGRGMSPDQVARAVDPFWTTRTCRRVGLGLPLLAATAQRCEGSMVIASQPGRGTTVTAYFRRSHIDRPPLGDLRATLVGALVGHPGVDIHYRHSVDGRVFQLDGAAIRRELRDVSISHPRVLRWLEQHVAEGLTEMGLGPISLEGESDAQVA